MLKESRKFSVLFSVRYTFDTQEEADNFAQFMKTHCDGYYVFTSNDEDVIDEK